MSKTFYRVFVSHVFILFFLIIFPLSFLHPSVVVSNVNQLVTAIENANNGGDTEIILQSGTYQLSDLLPIWADNVIVRSQTGDRDDVTIRGEGMYGSVTHIFNVAGTNFTARDMTIGWVANHAVQIWGQDSSSNTLLSNLRIVDTYEQMVKISYEENNSNRSEDGIMEYCLLEYSAGIGPQYYIGGIDGHQTRNWIVRNNTFKNISSPSEDIAEHAIHFWSDSEDTLVENNLIINCDRGIGFGLGSRGHSGGIIRNNMIYHNSSEGFADVAIGLESASNVKVYNNTIYMENSYANAIEYRYSSTSGGIIKNNLTNKLITSREGGSADLADNITNAQASWFEDVSTGDLHLDYQVTQVVDQGVSISGLTTDYDGDTRPQGAGIDIGADEYTTGTPDPTLTVTSPNGGESWNGGSMHTISWTHTGTVGNVKIQYSTNNGSNWSDITSSTSNDGSFSWTLPNVSSSTCLVRISEASDRDPSDVSDGTFSIATATGVPIISLNRTQLNYTAVSGGTYTSAQTISIDNTGTGTSTLNWSIYDDASWLQCTPSSGTSAAIVSAAVDPSGLSSGQYTATIYITDASASNSPQTISVNLTVINAAQGETPFGVFATPEHGSTVMSSIPVTGWVLDDIEVVSVKIYNGSAFVGDAVFVEGARPDVEADYPEYPFNYRAGWGYMLLTNFLPNGGNGTYHINAVATDAEGNTVSLGTKTIYCDNAKAVKPFGAIDTPAQGGIASGDAFVNWGWVLTPQPNYIPSDGSTIRVWLDGVELGHPTYNNYRSDIASRFPGYANSDGAVGYFVIDTTAYTNGVHNIHWTATDSGGNTDGIGSRYFSIHNAGSDLNETMEKPTVRGRFLSPVLSPGFAGPKASEVLGGFVFDESLPLRIVNHYGKAPEECFPLADGSRFVETTQLGHVEIHLDGVLEPGCGAGYIIAGDRLRPLPVGSTFDTARNIFYWHPGLGFYGDYSFVFLDLAHRIQYRIHIMVSPKYPSSN